MAKTLRVHILAKELGVPSKEIIAKCQAEGIELKNHMAALSVGLAESIREWFSTGDDVTSIEVADPVDLKSVRKPSQEEKAAEAGAGEAAATSTAVEEVAPAGEETESEAEADTDEGGSETETEKEAEAGVDVPPEPETPETKEPVADASAALAEAGPTVVPGAEEGAAKQAEPLVEEAGEEAPVAGATEAEEQGVEVVSGPAEEAAEPEGLEREELAAKAPEEGGGEAAGDAGGEGDVAGQVTPLEPEEPVSPAGPQVVPKPAELQGPRVVRIERPDPDHLAARRSRGPSEPRRFGGGGGAPPPAAPAGTPGGGGAGGPSRGRGDNGKRGGDEGDGRRGRGHSPRRRGGSDVGERIREWRDQDLIERKERLKSATGQGMRERRAAERRRRTTSRPSQGPAVRKTPVEITAPIMIKDYCAAVGVPFAVIGKKLLEHTGSMMTINQSIDAETAELLAMDLGVQLKVAKALTAYEKLQKERAELSRENLKPRPPVVAMLGHVDHGKTSLLDAIRRTNVVKGEAGGITQHIGAYRIDHEGWSVTFLDTPGHQAFTAMRSRGANLTDVVVLVIAADDGVMPQTAEAINHAKAAGVQIVVALNKIDLPGADLNRVYSQLAEHELVPSEWGGEVDVIKTSATTGEGVEELIAHLSTLSDLMDLKSDPSVPPMATVIEAQMREGQGVVAQVLVREGTLKTGQVIVCGPGFGRIRALRNDRGKMVNSVEPGTPVEIAGLDELPRAGDNLYVVDDLGTAKGIAAEVKDQRRQEELDSMSPAAKPRTLEALLLGNEESQIPSLNVIVKADVQGSVDVLKQTLGDIPADKVQLNILHAAVGAITEADVQLAQASDAIVFGFHVVPEDRARQLADQLGVEIRVYRVIYEILEDVQKALAGLLAPTSREERRGTAQVREVFNITRFGTVAGCLISDGAVARRHKIRLVRDGRIVRENVSIGSLRRFKDDVREVKAGLECGIKLDGFDDIKPGDVLEAYELIEVAPEL